jgi:subtilisin family serine protease
VKREVLSLCIIVSVMLSLFTGIITIAGLPPQSASTERTHVGSADYVKDAVLVRFKSEARKDGMVVPDIAAAAHASVGATEIRALSGVPGLQLVKLPKGVTVPAAVAQYEQNPNVLYAEPDYLRHIDMVPNDPYFSRLWGLYNSGQTVNGGKGIPGADIDAPEAWNKTTGSKDVIVAVLDTGVDYREPDLSPNIVNGWDFVANSSDPMDRVGHGTHVAGIIAAVGNNSIGVTGVMWKAKIMPLRVIGPFGAPDDLVIAAIDYANSHGAHIINMSFGGPEFSQSVKDAIDASPALCVCAAGNSGANNDQAPLYPASFMSDNIISVAATDQNGTLASFSDYGQKTVQVAAPGTNIYSTFPPLILLFSDPFNNFTAWDTQAPWHITNDQYASPPTSAMASSSGGSIVNASIMLKHSLDLTNKCGTTLFFNLKLDTVEDHGLFYIEATRDGVHWDTVDYGSGNSSGWITPPPYSLTNYDTSPNFNIRFRLTTDGNMTSSSVYVDNILIIAFDPLSAKQNYVFLDGTSMAAPYVSGLAGLVKAVNPSYTNLQIKDVILKNVDVESGLRGKISTGGRINASKTLSGIGPIPPLSLSITSVHVVPGYAQYLEWDVANTGSADAWVAPNAILYKPTAIAPYYAQLGDALTFYAYDSTIDSMMNVYPYGENGWFNVQPGHTYRVFSGPVVPSDAKWAVYNAQLYYAGAFHGWLYTSGVHYSTLR